MEVKCSYCHRKTQKSTGHYNRAMKLGARLYCSQKCFGLDRRTDETIEDKKRIKYFYDSFLNLDDPERYKDEAASWFKKDYAANPEKYRQRRQDRQPKHNEYCRQPKYKAWKQEYDIHHRCKKTYGEFGEAAVVLIKLERIIDSRIAKAQNGIINKSQKRKRQWRKIQAKTPLSSLLAI